MQWIRQQKLKRNAILRSSIVIVVLALALIWSGTACAAEPGHSDQLKLLHFPEQVSLGRLHVMSPERSIAKNMMGIELPYFGEAKGTIRVPKGVSFLLKVSYEASQKPALLAACAPDSFACMNFTSVECDDRTMASISHLTGLRGLDVAQTEVSDEGLKSVAKLNHLDYLRLNWTSVTNNGLKALIPLQSLTSLNMHNTNIGDEGLKYIQQLRQLKDFSAQECHITDKGLSLLGKLPELRYLWLGGNRKITARGALQLASLKKLKHLDLSNTSVTAKDLPVFQELSRRMPSLQILGLMGTGFTNDEEKKWTRTLPRLSIAF